MEKSKRINRVLAISVVLVTVITLVLPALAERGYPIGGNWELKVFYPIAGGSVLKSNADNTSYKEIEKRTGIKIKWIEPTQGMDQEIFNLMLASRDLPDVFRLPSGVGGWNNLPGGPQKYYDDKIILKLDKLIDKYAPNFKAALRKYPDARKELMADDGSIYYIPQLRVAPEIRVFDGFIIRQDWLDKLGLEVPVTVDDWYNVLKAFKTRDPNGNGQADEIPFCATRHGLIYEFTKMIWPWGVCYGQWYGNGLMQVRGKVVYSCTLPEFKEALAYCNKLYREGLLDPDFFMQDRNQFNAKVLGNRVGAFWGYAGSGISNFTTSMKGKEPKDFRLIGTPFPRLKTSNKKGYNFEIATSRMVSSDGFAITTACKRPDLAMKWLDYAYSKEGHMLLNFGVEGLTYNMVNGYPKYTELITKNPNGLSMDAALKAHCDINWFMIQDLRYFEQYQQLTPASWEADLVWTKSMDNSRILPGVSLTQEESQKTVAKFNEINTYVLEMYYKFIAGTEPLDNFDKFVAQLKRMGIDEIVKVYQDALDRYNRRK